MLAVVTLLRIRTGTGRRVVDCDSVNLKGSENEKVRKRNIAYITGGASDIEFLLELPLVPSPIDQKEPVMNESADARALWSRLPLLSCSISSVEDILWTTRAESRSAFLWLFFGWFGCLWS